MFVPGGELPSTPVCKVFVITHVATVQTSIRGGVLGLVLVIYPRHQRAAHVYLFGLHHPGFARRHPTLDSFYASNLSGD